jgi:hypothetical protein
VARVYADFSSTSLQLPEQLIPVFKDIAESRNMRVRTEALLFAKSICGLSIAPVQQRVGGGILLLLTLFLLFLGTHRFEAHVAAAALVFIACVAA